MLLEESLEICGSGCLNVIFSDILSIRFFIRELACKFGLFGRSEFNTNRILVFWFGDALMFFTYPKILGFHYTFHSLLLCTCICLSFGLFWLLCVLIFSPKLLKKLAYFESCLKMFLYRFTSLFQLLSVVYLIPVQRILNVYTFCNGYISSKLTSRRRNT